MLSWPGIFLMLQNQVISSFSLSKSVHPQNWWYDWMRSILTLTSELCECFAKVPVTIFQSLNGGIRNRVVIFIILNLGVTAHVKPGRTWVTVVRPGSYYPE